MNVIYNIFIYGFWFIATYYVVLFMLLLFLKKDSLYEKKQKLKSNPKVSVLVPAYNEAEKIAQTIRSLKKVTYENIEFIILNDGSKDNTSSVVRKEIRGDARFRLIDNKMNKGKAATLNQGIALSRGEYVACMDADSTVEKEIMQKVLPYFSDKKTGAVTVTVEVKRTKKFLHKLIDLEFIIGLSLFLKVSSFLNCVYVTPGPFSIYRKSVLNKIKGFDPENITEDLEIAYRIHKAGFVIKNCLDAKVYTIAPPTFRKTYIQRRRWYSGAIQTIIQHRKMLFNSKYGMFGYMIPYNYVLIFAGLILFFFTMYLGISDVVKTVQYFAYTDFNLWQRIADFKFDFLTFGRVFFIGLSGLVLSISLIMLGLKLSGKSIRARKLGIIGWPLMFYMYQIFWIGSIFAVLRGKRIKWR